MEVVYFGRYKFYHHDKKYVALIDDLRIWTKDFRHFYYDYFEKTEVEDIQLMENKILLPNGETIEIPEGMKLKVHPLHIEYHIGTMKKAEQKTVWGIKRAINAYLNYKYSDYKFLEVITKRVCPNQLRDDWWNVIQKLLKHRKLIDPEHGRVKIEENDYSIKIAFGSIVITIDKNLRAPIDEKEFSRLVNESIIKCESLLILHNGEPRRGDGRAGGIIIDGKFRWGTPAQLLIKKKPLINNNGEMVLDSPYTIKAITTNDYAFIIATKSGIYYSPYIKKEWLYSEPAGPHVKKILSIKFKDINNFGIRGNMAWYDNKNNHIIEIYFTNDWKFKGAILHDRRVTFENTFKLDQETIEAAHNIDDVWEVMTF